MIKKVKVVDDITDRKRADEAMHNLIEIIHFAEHVSTKIHGLLDAAGIYRTVKEAFVQSKRYTASILLLTDDGSSLRIAESSLSSAKVEAGEEATGLRLKGYKIDLKKSGIYSQIVREGKTVQAKVSDIIGELFPRPLAHLITKTTGYEKKSSILTPLKRHGKIIGAFAMTSPELTEHFIPSVINLARHISNSLEWADEYRERERAEEALRESEDRYRTVIEDTPALICRFRPDGTLTFVNSTYCQYFGKTYEELVGHNFFQFIPAEDREKVREHYNSISKEKPAITYEHQVIAPDGTIRWQRWTDRGLFDEGGGLVEYQSIGEDITDRKQAEEELRELSEQLRNLSVHLQSVSEEERTNIAREIHDELAQALTALQIDLYWLGERIPAGKEDLIQKINSMSHIVETVIQSTQRISTKLRPVLLDTLGLSAAIEWQVEEFQKRTGIQCEVVIDSADIDLDPERSTAIFRILQESLTNVARHADAKEVWVRLNRHSDKLILEVVDNGKGITQDQILSSMAFGLIGMRERIRPWKGDFNISGINGKGTTVIATISLDS